MEKYNRHHHAQFSNFSIASFNKFSLFWVLSRPGPRSSTSRLLSVNYWLQEIFRPTLAIISSEPKSVFKLLSLVQYFHFMYRGLLSFYDSGSSQVAVGWVWRISCLLGPSDGPPQSSSPIKLVYATCSLDWQFQPNDFLAFRSAHSLMNQYLCGFHKDHPDPERHENCRLLREPLDPACSRHLFSRNCSSALRFQRNG